eukprot:m.98052 g.98052  ORF g.98052 m.98052 type:complete len:115 (+) comp36969_c0_seq32:2283-2627(+)
MNVCILRNFQNLDKSHLKHGTIDVWPLYKVDIEDDNEKGNPTGLLLLQLAWILHKVHGWKSNTKLRVMILSDPRAVELEKKRVNKMMKLLRIPAETRVMGGMSAFQFKAILCLF